MSQMTETQKNQNANYSTEYLVDMKRFMIIYMNEEEIDNKVSKELERNAFAVKDSLRSQYEESFINQLIENINDKVKKETTRNVYANKYELREQYIMHYMVACKEDYINKKVQLELKRNAYANKEELTARYIKSLVVAFVERFDK